MAPFTVTKSICRKTFQHFSSNFQLNKSKRKTFHKTYLPFGYETIPEQCSELPTKIKKSTNTSKQHRHSYGTQFSRRENGRCKPIPSARGEHNNISWTVRTAVKIRYLCTNLKYFFMQRIKSMRVPTIFFENIFWQWKDAYRFANIWFWKMYQRRKEERFFYYFS